MRILAIDHGRVRVGLAVSDSGRSFAFPFGTLSADRRLVPAIAAICAAEGVGEIVVGLPRTLAGHAGTQAAAVQRFAGALRRAVPVPVVFEDERLSSVFANRELGVGSARADRDSVAAATILESYLTRLARADYA